MHRQAPWGGSELELLDPNEELELVTQYRRTQDRQLEDRLVRSQLRLVAHLAKRLYVDEREREDVLQEGSLGLVTAVRRFDPTMGIRLSTYAAWWIRAYQLRYLMGNHRLVRIGTSQSQRKTFWQLRRTRERLLVSGRDATHEAIASELGVDVDAVRSTDARMELRDMAIDCKTRRGPSLGDRLASTAEDAETKLEREELVQLVRSEAECLRASLDDRDRVLFDARFRDDATSLAKLGARFGVTRERARQLEARVLATLRKRVEHALAA